MSPEIITALIGLVGVIIGAIPTYIFMRQKGTAEIDKLKAETDKTRAEAEEIRTKLKQTSGGIKNGLAPADKTISSVVAFDTNIQKDFRLEEILKTARTVDILGYNLKSLLQVTRQHIASAVDRGAVVRIVIVDVYGPSFSICKEHSNRSELLLSDWIAALKHLNDIQCLIENKRVVGRLEIKVTDWIPSCNLILIDSKEKDGIVKVGINSLTFRQPLAGRLNMVMTKENHPETFDFFVTGFETIFNDDSKPWDKRIPSLSESSVI